MVLIKTLSIIKFFVRDTVQKYWEVAAYSMYFCKVQFAG